MISLLALVPMLLQTGAASPPETAPALENWGHWRGPLQSGVAPRAEPPLVWSETENVRWKVALPGKGHSSPVVWGERVFVTSALAVGAPVGPFVDDAPGTHDSAPVTHALRSLVLALERASGKVQWQVELDERVPHEGGHVTGSHASASPETDGEVVVAPFGSRGLFVLDVQGNLLWKQELGRQATKHAHGEGSSPLLVGESVVVVQDHEGASFVAAFERRTGKERWRVARDEETSWASPIAVTRDGQTQIVVSGTKRIRGYDLATGEVLWATGGLSSNVVCSPVSDGQFVWAGSSYESQALLAIDLSRAKGDVTGTDVVPWVRRRATPYVPSLLLLDGSLYFLHHYQGFLSRVEARTGKEPARATRLEGMDDVYASPVAAAGRIYVTDRSGVTAVLAPGTLELLAQNVLDDSFSASAALAGRALFLRGERALYCLAEE